MFGLGSSSQLGIGIAIKLNDQFSGQAAKVNQALVDMRKNANSAVTGAIRDYRNNALAIAGGAAAITMGMVKMTQEGADFQHQINQVFIVGGKELGRTRDQLSTFAQNMSKVFTRTPAEIAAAMFENAKQGITEGIENITKYQIAVSTATDEPLSQVADNLLSIMNAMDIDKTHFGDIANVVTAVANATQASVSSIGESMKYAAFTAHQFNLPLSTTVALVGKLSQAGITGSAAGTGINNLLTQMAKSLGPFQSKSQLKAWKMLGLDPKQITEMANKGDITGVISAVSNATKSLSPIEKGSILPRAFNMRGTRAMEALFESEHGNKSIGNILKSAQEGIKNDVAMKQSKAMMNDLASDFKLLRNAALRFAIAFTTAAAPTLRILMGVLTKVVGMFSKLMDTPIGKVLAGVAFVVAPLIAIMFAFRAAVFTATLALRGFGSTSQIGGWRSLLGAGLGEAGSAGLGALGGKFGPANAMGMRRVLAGETIDIGGKIFKGGQFLPKAFMGSAGAGLASRASGFFGRGLGFLGDIAGKGIPILGEILLGIEAVKLLMGIANSNVDRRETYTPTDPLLADYHKNLDAEYSGYTSPMDYYRGGGKSKFATPAAQQGASLMQAININVDGRSVMAQTFDQKIEDIINGGMINLNVKN